MASNLSVITATANGVVSRSLSGAPTSGARSEFAAMLKRPDEPKPTPATEQKSAAPAANADEDDKPHDDADVTAVAALVDLAQPIQVTPTPALSGLVNDLADLRKTLEAGKTPDPALVDKIGAALNTLADALGVSLDDLPSLDDLKAMAAKTDPANSTTSALAGFAGELAANGDLPDDLKAIADKLGALLKAIGDGKVAPDRLATLGLPGTTEADPALDAATAKLLAAANKVDASANAQTLATPSLSLGDTALAKPSGEGKSKPADDKPADVSAPKAARKTAAKDNEAAEHRRPIAPPAAATAEKAPDPQASVHTAAANSQVDAVATPRVLQTGYQTSQQQLNLPQIAFELARQTTDGNTRFQIRLDPLELGKIDVRLDIDASGRVTARLTVEKPETLDMMQRDQKGLERALQQAGLDGAKTSLEFSLKQNPFAGGNQHGREGREQMFGTAQAAAEPEAVAPPTISLYRGSLSASGVNILA